MSNDGARGGGAASSGHPDLMEVSWWQLYCDVLCRLIGMEAVADVMGYKAEDCNSCIVALPPESPSTALSFFLSQEQELPDAEAGESREDRRSDVVAAGPSPRLDCESCICGGYLLRRAVVLRHGPSYTAVASPLLIALDLDGTILHTPLSKIDLAHLVAQQPHRIASLFVDLPFFCRFCAAAARRGHELAICSFTDGCRDGDVVGWSAEKAVWMLLSQVLPVHRGYFTAMTDVICSPQTSSNPGKLLHLSVLQRRRTEKDRCSAASAALNLAKTNPSSPGHPISNDSSSSGTHMDSCIPKWVPTDVVLIDDDGANCAIAAAHAYHVAHCSESGLSLNWYAKNFSLQQLLKIPAVEVASDVYI